MGGHGRKGGFEIYYQLNDFTVKSYLDDSTIGSITRGRILNTDSCLSSRRIGCVFS